MPILTDLLIKNAQVGRGEKTDLFTLLTAALASTATRQSTDFVNKYSHGLVIIVKLANEVGVAGYTPKVNIVDNAGNNILWWQAATELTAAGTYVYVLFPGGMTGKASGVTEAADIVMPRVWNFLLTKSTGDANQKFDTEVYAQYL